MKRFTPFFILAMMAALIVFGAKSANKFVEVETEFPHGFLDSYAAYMNRMTGSGMAEMRAQDARIYVRSEGAGSSDSRHSGIGLATERKPDANLISKTVCLIRDVGSYRRACVY